MAAAAHGIDHLVLAFRSLAAARDLYQRMGFTLTPIARHPWGTENSLVQLDGAYLELLAIADASLIPEHGHGTFSFGAFSRDFVARREGFSMLALETQDAQSDRKRLRSEGIATYEPFFFSRKGKLPNGEEGEFSFTLCFVSDRCARDVGFFMCERRTTVPFWQPAYQAHANAAQAIAEVVMVAPEPAKHRDFLLRLTGGMLIESRREFHIDTPRGRITVSSAAAASEAWGKVLPSASEPYLAAYAIKVADLDKARAALAAGGIEYKEEFNRVVVQAKDAAGVAIGFTQTASGA